MALERNTEISACCCQEALACMRTCLLTRYGAPGVGYGIYLVSNYPMKIQESTWWYDKAQYTNLLSTEDRTVHSFAIYWRWHNTPIHYLLRIAQYTHLLSTEDSTVHSFAIYLRWHNTLIRYLLKIAQYTHLLSTEDSIIRSFAVHWR